MSKEFFNEMPRPTFRWLRVNHYESTLGSINKNEIVRSILSGDEDCVAPLTDKQLLNSDFKGVNEKALREVAQDYTEGYAIHVPKGEHKSVTMQIDLKEKAAFGGLRIRITIEEEASLEVLFSIEGNDDCEGFFQNFVEVQVAPKGSVRLKRVQLANKRTQLLEHLYAHVEDEGQLELLNIEVGGHESLYNYESDLVGKKSHISHRFAYLGDDTQRFDINMLMNHRGVKSTSDIHNMGALSGDAVKAFRGTLDFKRGCHGSEGSEEDTCLLLNKTVKSISVPLLLCKEDDVVGNHAASAGQLDPNRLFYLMSRGFSEDEAKHILVESMLRPVVDQLNHPALEEKALSYIREKI